MTIENMTIGELREVTALLAGGGDDHPFEIGANYFVRTVTMILTGKLVAVTKTELVLVDAAWIADTGRYAVAIASGNFSEVEPYPDGATVIVGRGALIDAVTINSLPRVQS